MITRRRIVTVAAVAAVAAALIGVSVPAWAYFTATASSNITASAKTLAAVTGPTATTVNSTDATVSWTDTTNPSGTTYTGTATMVQSPHTVVTCVVTGMTCKASALTASTQYTFSVAPAIGTNWAGPAAAVNLTTLASPGNALVFTSSAVSGASSSTPNLGPITVQRTNGSGTAVTSGSTTVTLTSTSLGPAFGTLQFGSTTTSVIIGDGQSTAKFFYGDTAVGAPTITASATGFDPATQQETITTAPTGLAIAITGGDGTPTLGGCGAISASYSCTISGVGSGGKATFTVGFVSSTGAAVVYSTTQDSTITESGQAGSGSVTIPGSQSSSGASTLTAGHSGSSTKSTDLKFGPYILTLNVQS